VLEALPGGSLGVPFVRAAGVAPLYFINQQVDFVIYNQTAVITTEHGSERDHKGTASRMLSVQPVTRLAHGISLSSAFIASARRRLY